MSDLFPGLLKDYREGRLNPDKIRLEAVVSPPSAEDLLVVADLAIARQEQLNLLGLEAVAAGEVAAVVLAGGMATRFAFDAPKGLFPILGEVTFLELKVRALCGQGIPLYLMTSFHTHQATLDFLEAHDFFGFKDQIYLFEQFKLPRIQPDGELVKHEGEIDHATAGHGDFVDALRSSGSLARLQQEGRKYLLFSNIDNLGASFEPVLLGLHIEQQVEMSIEVAAKAPGDKGGAPARVDGQLQLVEEFLFPLDFDQDQIRVFNTATYIFSTAALDRDFDLPWYVVSKNVRGQDILQFEHLAGDLSRELKIQCLFIARESRFLPVKKQEDVPKVQDLITQKYGHLL